MFSKSFMNYNQNRDLLDLFLYNTFENITQNFTQIIPYLKIYNIIKKNNDYNKKQKIISNTILNSIFSYCLYDENNLGNSISLFVARIYDI